MRPLGDRDTIVGRESDPRDELDDYLAERTNDPTFAAAYEDAGARSQLLRSMLAARHVREISQGTVAGRMGTTQSAVSDLERGATDPRLSTLQRYARAIGCRLVLVLHVTDPGGWLPVHSGLTSWPPVRVGVGELAGSHDPAGASFWAPLADQYSRHGSPRLNPFAPILHTNVAPVELREHADSYAMEIRR